MKIVIANHVHSLNREIECKKCTLSPNKEIASTVFAQLIHIAVHIFAGRLMLGGEYNINSEAKMVILNHLCEIEKVIEHYETESIK